MPPKEAAEICWRSLRIRPRRIGDKIDVKREIETILAAKQYEFRVMSAVPYVIIGYMTLSFPEIYGHFIWKSGRNRGDDGMFADLCGARIILD